MKGKKNFERTVIIKTHTSDNGALDENRNIWLFVEKSSGGFVGRVLKSDNADVMRSALNLALSSFGDPDKVEKQQKPCKPYKINPEV